MKSTLILTMAVAVLAGCQQSSSSGGAATQSTAQPVAPVASSSATQTLPKFEVRDFKLDEKRTSGEITEFNGRGTLVAKDDALKRGNYMVWLSVKQTLDNDEITETQSVLLRDGIGTIETFAYARKVKYFDWKILGFIKLQEGVVVVDEPVATK